MKLFFSTFFTFLSLFTSSLFGQDTLQLVYIKAPGVFTSSTFKLKTTPEVFYKKTLEWVQETYKNPENVLVGQVEYKSIKINAINPNAISYKNNFNGSHFSLDWEYYLTVSIIGESVLFQISHQNSYLDGKSYPNINPSFFYKKDGSVNKMGEDAIPNWENQINQLLISLEKRANDPTLSPQEALNKLKFYKDQLDLGLITQEEYEKFKKELSVFIK